MIKIKKISLLILSAALLPSAFSADIPQSKSDISVTGSISPGSCNINIDGGNIDYGDIAGVQLLSTAGPFHKLEAKEINYSIICPQETRVKMIFTDSNQDTVHKDLAVKGHFFGLGSGTDNLGGAIGIGGYTISLKNLEVDGRTTKKDINNIVPNYVYRYDFQQFFSKNNAKVFTGTYRITPHISTKNNISSDSEIKLNGSVIMGVEYY
ncbi:DUF1120 domain-containing protein [Yersinia ruckeri]